MKLSVGDYIRTNEGIRKIIREYSDGECYELNRDLHYKYPEGHDLDKKDIDDIVLKSSPNIIDLIEVGDYVNDSLVVNKKLDSIDIIQLILPFELKNKDIKSIVTKEQFEQMEYKIN